MFHPKLWSITKFVDRACVAEKMSPGFIHCCFGQPKKELEKLVKLSKSKILTFAVFVLQVQCEAEILYTVLLLTLYLFVLCKQHTRDDVLQLKKAKAAHLFNDDKEEIDGTYGSDTNSVTVTTFVGGCKGMKITKWYSKRILFKWKYIYICS
jgi:hypothetical protein